MSNCSRTENGAPVPRLWRGCRDQHLHRRPCRATAAVKAPLASLFGWCQNDRVGLERRLFYSKGNSCCSRCTSCALFLQCLELRGIYWSHCLFQETDHWRKHFAGEKKSFPLLSTQGNLSALPALYQEDSDSRTHHRTADWSSTLMKSHDHFLTSGTLIKLCAPRCAGQPRAGMEWKSPVFAC